MFLHVPDQGAQGRSELLGAYLGQPGHRRTVFGKRGRYAPHEEFTSPGRRSVSLHAHAQDVPEAQASFCPPSGVQDHGAGTILGPVVPAATMDQQHRSQPHGVGARPRSLRHVLLQHAVRCLHRAGGDLGASGRDHVYLLPGDHLHRQTAGPADPADPPGSHPGPPGHPDRGDGPPVVLCAVDDDLPGVASDLELRVAGVRVLEVRRLQLGRHEENGGGEDEESRDRIRRRVRQQQNHDETMGGLRER